MNRGLAITYIFMLAVTAVVLITRWSPAVAASGDTTQIGPPFGFGVFSSVGGKVTATRPRDRAIFEGVSSVRIQAVPGSKKIRIIGGSSGAINATQVAYTNPTYTTVASALDSLLYVAPSAPSVTGGSSNEVGSTVTSVALNWSITLGTKALTSQSIDNGIGAIDTALRTYTHSLQSITTNRTYTVSITDGTTPRTGSTTVAFYRKRHWGATATPLASIDSAAILALGSPSNEFATTHTKSVIYDCTGGKYPTFAYPTSFGALNNVTVGGLAFTDYTCSTVSHTNASGSIANYYVCQFNYLQTGSAINVSWD